MSKSPNIDVQIVVSGQTITIRTNLNQTVEHLVREALKESGNRGQPADQWELRTSDGALVDQSIKVEAAGIVGGVTLYLSPRAGAGGE
jgi:hypothetical protein